MSEILVIGHRNPDTDSICSAIGYAEFKHQMGFEKVIAARCGDINDRTNFVLRHFGVAPPRFVADVSPKVRDVMQHRVASISPDATASEALSMMEKGNLRVLPIVDEDRFCQGLISVFKMGKFLLSTSDRSFSSRRVLASIASLSRNLDANLLFGVSIHREENLFLMVGAMGQNSFANRLESYRHERVIVVVGDRQNIQSLAIHHRVRAVIVTGNLEVSKEVIQFAKQNEVSLLVSPHDSATTLVLCRSAIAARHMMHEHFLAFGEDEPLSSIRDLAVSSQFQAFPVLDAYKRVVGVLSKTDLLKQVDRKLILVDHNELSQAVKGADQVEIIEIIDHHRIGSFTSNSPMLFINRPVGSTSTIIADLFFTYNLPLPKEIGGLLLAGLVSDTLNLTSPTTTEIDASILSKLSDLTGIDPNEFTERLFSSGSVLTGLPAAEAIAADCKEYEETGKRFSVAQIEELGFKHFWERRDDVIAALETHRAKGGYLFSGLMVTDVVRQLSLLLVAGEAEFVSRIHYPQIQQGIFELSGIVSRKKQLLPYLIHCLEMFVKGNHSTLAGHTAKQIVRMDEDVLRFQTQTISIGVAFLEDRDIHGALQRRAEILSALRAQCAKEVAVEALIVAERDGGEAALFVSGNTKFVKHLGYPQLHDGVYSLPTLRSKASILSTIKRALSI